MKKYFIIIGVLFVALLISVGFFLRTVLFTEGRHYDDVDTGIRVAKGSDKEYISLCKRCFSK
jgi:sensor domain CHASE-containing protein